MAAGPDIVLTDEFRHCLAEVEQGANLFITGKAGTGKSTLLRLIREQHGGKKVAVVAPTGVAALNVDGETIHRFFAFRAELTKDLRKYRPPECLGDIDILVVDEVSMVRADLMDKVSLALQRKRQSREPFGGVQLVLIGDLFQLPPVSEELRDEYYATDFFFSSNAFRESRITTIELTKVFRQRDQLFIEILNAVRDGSFSAEHLRALNSRFKPDYRHVIDSTKVHERARTMTIATTRAYVEQINSLHLDGLPGDESIFPAERFGEIDNAKFDGLEELRLKPGAQVMMLVNQHGYANGTLAEVIDLAPDVITVYFPERDEPQEIRPYVWEVTKTTRVKGRVEKTVVGQFRQFPMQLAWAVTVHKSQGKTFDRVVFDCKRVFEDGQTYVALSRCTSLDGITLTQEIEPRHIKISSAVRRFHRAATRPTFPTGSFPVAYVGLHTTGNDKYRKLVELAIIRTEGGSEQIRISSLIAPGRDASDAASIGINASDLTMCPSIEEARDILGLALDGAVVVGLRIHDLFALAGWPEGDVDEGVPYDIGAIPFGDGEKPTAMELAEQAMADFHQFPIGHRRRIQVAPFRFLKRTVGAGAFLACRSPASGMDHLLQSPAYEAFDSPSQAAVRLGIATGLIADATPPSMMLAEQCLAGSGVSVADAEAMRDRLLDKAKRDSRVSSDELAFLTRFCRATATPLAAVAEGDYRARVEFRDGMRIYLSGGPGKAGSACEGMSKADLMELCEHTGLEFVTSSMRKKDKFDAVVVADLSTEGKSRANAERWGIPVMSWEELLEWATAQRSKENRP